MMRMVPDIVRAALRLFAGLALATALVAAAHADEARDRLALDRLFTELKSAPDAQTAHRISQRIWAYWTIPSDPILAGRMDEVFNARHAGDIDEAVLLLDRLVEDYPDYAEGWNQRATMHYLLEDFEASLADCAKALALEPRHFGALSGRALIYLQQGRRGLALKDMAAALSLHPFLNERRLFPELRQQMTRV
jgi:tetratricopeptide (TPR) repeat protein